MRNPVRLRVGGNKFAICVEKIKICPFYQYHKLKGDRDGIWSMTVSGNWRITFEFIDGDAYVLNYEDYH